MSATNRTRADGKRTERQDEDTYLTPPDCAFTTSALLPLVPGMRVLEPSAGSGSYLVGIHRAHGLVAEAIEKRREAAPALRVCIPGVETRVRTCRFEDVVEPESVDAVVGTPPYVRAQEHVQHALYLLRRDGLLGFLLRINFLSSQERYPFFQRFPPWRVYVLRERPDFTGDGGDATEYAFMVWRKGFLGDTVTRWVSWKDEALRRADIARVRRLDWVEREAA